MLTLRKLEKTINQFYDLVNKYPEEIKKDLDTYGLDAKVLNDLMKDYIDDLQNEYIEIDAEYKAYLKEEKLNIFHIINMKSLVFYMEKYKELIKKATEMQRKIEKVELRIKQFKYFS